VFGPHPRPFSRGEKGANPLSPRERAGVRAQVIGSTSNSGF
jgi:hypothetical protein